MIILQYCLILYLSATSRRIARKRGVYILYGHSVCLSVGAFVLNLAVHHSTSMFFALFKYLAMHVVILPI